MDPDGGISHEAVSELSLKLPASPLRWRCAGPPKARPAAALRHACDPGWPTASAACEAG